MNATTETNVRLFASAQSWIEGEALRQLYAAAQLEGMRLAVGFPDLHPGKGGPVGAGFVSEGRIHPYLIGGDIGCGMALFKTELLRRDINLDRCSTFRFDLEHPWDGNTSELLAKSGLEPTEYDDALGTIGGGNHFAELQGVEEILDPQEFKQLFLGKQQLVLLVHSGSRGFGQSILRSYVDEHQASGADPESFAGATYLRDHNVALRWAKVNRSLIASRFCSTLHAESELLWDGCHNSITRHDTEDGSLWIHRKGAVDANAELLVIPGSRGTLSYLVKPLGDGHSHAWSLAHGAGRKWSRSEGRLRVRERFRPQQLVQTPLGGRVICEERELLYEEAPAAYKDIEKVIKDLVDAALIKVIATFRPLLTYKTRTLRR